MAEIYINELVSKYKKFVIENPLAASELEVALKWISYFAAGRFSQSVIVSELMHSASNLLTFVNDMILRKAADIHIHSNALVEKLQTILSVFDYIEVFAEVTARKIGNKTRWLVIVLLQIIKTVIRLLLVLKFRQGVLKSPPIPPLNRRTDVPEFCNSGSSTSTHSNDATCQRNMEVTFTLRRSGRVIRTLEAAPPLSARNWKVPKPNPNNDIELVNLSPTSLEPQQIVGEVMHISRPMTHLLAHSVFGKSSWKPFFVALIMDCASLRLVKHGNTLNYRERVEISRRMLSLLLYLLRSPLYENAVEVPLVFLLHLFANKIKGGNLFIKPFIEYLPEWQQTYFYNWAL